MSQLLSDDDVGLPAVSHEAIHGALSETLLPSPNRVGAALIGTLAERMKASAQSMADQPENTGSALDWAMAVAGGPRLGEVLGPARAATAGIRAYHGSPHDFDRFDISKIGTGEGAQSYGHGLYFAENEGVAKGYRDALSSNVNQPEVLAKQLMQSQGSRDKALTVLDALENPMTDANGRRVMFTYPPETVQKAREFIQSGNIPEPRPPGHMYEVNINARPEQFLDWDSPFREQPPSIQEALRARLQAQLDQQAALRSEILERGTWPSGRPLSARDIDRFGSPMPSLEEITGSDVYKRVGSPATNQTEGFQQASDRLRDAGIPGLRYFDQGSRSAGDGSRNYVIFDDALIDILRKYGLIGLAPMGAAMARDQDREFAGGGPVLSDADIGLSDADVGIKPTNAGSSGVGDFLKSIPRGALSGLMGTASAGAEAEAL